MILKKNSILLLLLVFLISPAFAQRDTVSLNTIITKTAKFTGSYPIEKVYLHLDKPYYAANDTIWFKAYVTIDNHQPTVLSSIVYVDLINSRDSVMQFLKIPVVNGIAFGNIILKASDYRQGNYHLRGYTNWMRNFDPDYFFNKNIIIGNAIENSVKTNASFSSAASAGQVKINAKITFSDAADTKLPGKKVSWSVTVNDNEVSKGKVNTDANGIANILFTGNAGSLQNGILTTVIDAGNRKSVSNSFPLRTAAALKDVQFFPEGGEFYTGIRSKVAFKAINTNGLGIDVKGTITDNTGAVAANIISQHAGMGVFALLPEAGKTYKASITFADGSSASYDLPAALASGINLAAYNNDPANLNIKISATAAYLQANQGKPLYVIAQSGGAVYFAAQTSLQNAVYSANIPKTKFPTGIVQLTLFTATGMPLSERIVFIQHNDALNISLTAGKKIYNVRENVKVTVSANNKLLPVAGTFSVAVIDESKIPFNENAETTILSNLLLTSDLKGYIENPNYYFISKEESAADNLDMLMLTQGYRRLSYRNILADKLPQINILPEQNGIEVSGMLRSSNGMPIAKGNLRLQIPNRNFSTETITDMVGNFKFSKLSFPDSAQLIVTGRNGYTSKDLMVNVNGESYQPVTKNSYVADEVTNIDSAFKPYLLNSKKQYDNLHILGEVVIKSTFVTKKPSHQDYPGFAGLSMDADQTVDGERFKDCQNFFTCIGSSLLGITFDNGNLYLSKNYLSGNKTPVQIFVDGKPVDANYLNNVNGSNVATVEVFKDDGLSSINRTYGTAGIIMVNLKKAPKGTKMSVDEIKELLPQPNVVKFSPMGYSIARAFYSPKYLVAKPGYGADLRSTIYWNPNVSTDKTGTASFEFYNADGRGTYRATIEGFDADGNLGRTVLRYTVK